jgi:hypothetical protein
MRRAAAGRIFLHCKNFGLLYRDAALNYPGRCGNSINGPLPQPSKRILDHAMIKPFDDMQRLSQTNLDTAMKLFGEWNKGWQAIAAEMSDYTKRSFEEGTATFEKLIGAKSLEQAYEIQANYAKRAYDDYMHQVSKIGGMYAALAKEAYKPVERALQTAR